MSEPDIAELLQRLDERATLQYEVERSGMRVGFATPDANIAAWPRAYLDPVCSFTPSVGLGHGGRIVCVADHALHQTLRGLLADRPAAATATYEAIPAASIRLAGGLVALAYTERAGVTVVDAAHERVHYLTDSVPDARFESARLIRELLRRRGEDRDEVTIHAGAVLVAGGAWVVPGPKGAGKTTAVCALLEHLGADFVANDRVHLSRVGGEFGVRAWPMTTRIGIGTCLASDRLRGWLRPAVPPAYPQTGWDPAVGLSRTEAALLAGSPAGPKIELVTAELVATLRCRAAAGGPIAGVLVPRRDPKARDATVTPSNRDRTLRLLLEQSFTPDDTAYPDWLGLRRRSRSELAQTSAALLRRLVSTVPVVDVVFADARSLANRIAPVFRSNRPTGDRV
jgi:hypothetical protein